MPVGPSARFARRYFRFLRPPQGHCRLVRRERLVAAGMVRADPARSAEYQVSRVPTLALQVGASVSKWVGLRWSIVKGLGKGSGPTRDSELAGDLVPEFRMNGASLEMPHLCDVELLCHSALPAHGPAGIGHSFGMQSVLAGRLLRAHQMVTCCVLMPGATGIRLTLVSISGSHPP